MTSVSDHRKRNTFTSYVAPPAGDVSSLAPDDEWCLPGDMRDVHSAKPRLLPNELVAASAPVYMYPAISPMGNRDEEDVKGSKGAIFGLLSVTNFKLAFVPLQRESSLSAISQEHLLLSRNEITLNNIDQIYQIAETGKAASALPGNVGRRKKKLDGQQKPMSGRIAHLHILCKNFRLLKFCFHYSKGGRDWGKQITSALARFAFPTRHDLSFAYCYQEPYYSTISKSAISMYMTKNDWARELIRCGTSNWQVISRESEPLLQRERSSSRYTLPPHFVIPKACEVEKFLNLSLAFCDSRAAFWVYGYGNASLVRLAELKPGNQQDSTLENVMLEVVRASNDRKLLHLLQLTDRLPSILDVQKAYEKLRRICAPESPQHFSVEDSKFLVLLEKSNWLFYVSLCLRYSCEAADKLKEGWSCVLQESNGRDLCCVVSSLTQIILDPFYRTIDGFQSLIQKEWVALEHPFQRRLGQIRQIPDSNGPQEESPVFLLFLDCVWQLLQQFPDEFEFSQTYLTTLWDSCFMPIFDTFQFDCNADRLKAVEDHKLILRPVWDWSEQFLEKDKLFFSNPFYQKQKTEVPCRRSVAIPAGAVMLPGLARPPPAALLSQQRSTISPANFVAQSSIPKDRYLQPDHRMPALAIWEQCYYRWMPIVEIKRGGFPQIELQHRLLLSNISKLQRCLELQEFEDLPDVYYEMTKETRPLGSTETRVPTTPELIDGVERRRRVSLPPTAVAALTQEGVSSVLPEISSFFPFSVNTGETQQLHDILSSSHEFLLEGSIMDRLSVA
ncbi:myotubularin-related protein 10-B [Haematobia irritans]|uniref:myotubularin-related protein 10-B n=1 Tax=Haematobia irritans TaxID=7368 RepID=UPI003F501E64